jgi:hypothetical protein
MIVLSLAEIAAVTAGILTDAPDPDARVTGLAASDSRQPRPPSTPPMTRTSYCR